MRIWPTAPPDLWRVYTGISGFPSAECSPFVARLCGATSTSSPTSASAGPTTSSRYAHVADASRDVSAITTRSGRGSSPRSTSTAIAADCVPPP